MISELFKSKLAYRILGMLIASPGKEYYLATLTKKVGGDAGNVSRELSRLEKMGIVKMNIHNDKKYYSFNQDYMAAKELEALINKAQTGEINQRLEGKWLLAEDIPNIDPFFSMLWLNSFVDEFAEPGGRAYKKIAAVYKDYYLKFYYDEQDACEVGEHIVNRFFADPEFMEEVNKNITSSSDELRVFASAIPETNLDKLSNKELWKIYSEHDEVHTRYYQWGWLPVAADMFCSNLHDRGQKVLRDLGVSDDNLNDYLATLTQPTRPSLLKEEEHNLMRIGSLVQKDAEQVRLFDELFRKFKEEDVKEFGLYTHSPEYEAKFEERVHEIIEHINPKVLQELQDHYANYFYTKFLFTEEQGVYSFEHYLKELVRIVVNTDNLQQHIAKEKQEIIKAKKKRDDLMDALQLSKKDREFFVQWGEFMVTKIYRRYAQLFALYKMTPILEEIGKRLGLTIKQTRFMMIDEVKRALASDEVDIDEVKRRVSYSVYYADKNNRSFYTGSAAKRAAELIEKQEIEEVSELSGQCGCQGSATGTVKIVNVIEDMKKMNDGDILVSISTQPDLLPAMKKAAAFVTEQGGVTSHAAIVAREMNTPCVIGTKIATKVLKDGDKVEVDATKGIVRKLN